MADPDLQISGGGGGGWGGGKGGYLDPDIREGTGLQKFLFSVLGPTVWSKNKGGSQAPQADPLDMQFYNSKRCSQKCCSLFLDRFKNILHNHLTGSVGKR